jgi:hypothetical protein
VTRTAPATAHATQSRRLPRAVKHRDHDVHQAARPAEASRCRPVRGRRRSTVGDGRASTCSLTYASLSATGATSCRCRCRMMRLRMAAFPDAGDAGSGVTRVASSWRRRLRSSSRNVLTPAPPGVRRAPQRFSGLGARMSWRQTSTVARTAAAMQLGDAAAAAIGPVRAHDREGTLPRCRGIAPLTPWWARLVADGHPARVEVVNVSEVVWGI